MNRASNPLLLLWTIVLGAAIGAVAWSASAAAGAHAAVVGRQAGLHAIAAQSDELAAIASLIPEWAMRPRPVSGLATRVTTALETAGLPASTLSTLTGDGESPPSREPRVAKRRVTFTLTGITLPALGRFLGAWRSAQPDWTVASIDLSPATGPMRGAPRRSSDPIAAGTDLPLAAVIAVEYVFLDGPPILAPRTPTAGATP
ncbi:MAG: hypothetical protein KF745_14055 [Phycisphaeraceae bacterium]|nr:hypothetical protein [Phycisphaeraceae bacterium]